MPWLLQPFDGFLGHSNNFHLSTLILTQISAEFALNSTRSLDSFRFHPRFRNFLRFLTSFIPRTGFALIQGHRNFCFEPMVCGHNSRRFLTASGSLAILVTLQIQIHRFHKALRGNPGTCMVVQSDFRTESLRENSDF